MARQKDLPSIERESIPEITEAAEEYVKVRDRRIKALTQELEKKEALLPLMKEHKKTAYRDDDLIVI